MIRLRDKRPWVSPKVLPHEDRVSRNEHRAVYDMEIGSEGFFENSRAARVISVLRFDIAAHPVAILAVCLYEIFVISAPLREARGMIERQLHSLLCLDQEVEIFRGWVQT